MSGSTGVLDGKSRGPDPVGQERKWSPEIMENLYNLLYRVDLGNRKFGPELEKLERDQGEEVYSELVYLLSHLRYSPPQAKRHWFQILAHQKSMEKRFGAKVDLRVALVSYFVEVNQQLKNPKIIELKVFEQTQASVYRDQLTGLCNYRYFREHLDREVSRSVRYNSPISLVMIDVDNFKNYNDRNGHEAGNTILSTLACLLSDSLRTVDVSARYGGEEFALILPATTKMGAQHVAERARERIEKHRFPNEDSQPDGVLTVSMGVATYPADATEPNELIRHADRALYFAKSNGKNQVHLYGHNRRSYQRVFAKLEGTYQALAQESFPMTILNLSEGGLLFQVDRNLPMGTLIRTRFMIPEEKKEISLSARVIRVEETGKEVFQVGVRILEILAADWCLLSRYIGKLDKRQKAGIQETVPASVGS
ncbi:MAG: diguanylate cyclase [Acidobacteria bacterium]|nr:diguanylate cyclase [Acidobacteriota bacterium]